MPIVNKDFVSNKGFTLVELMVSIGIFAFMTALHVAKYGTFNQGILLTNLAYDVALTIRNAQSYGLNVKSKPSGGTDCAAGGSSFSNCFDYPYGVHFDEGASGDPAPNTRFVFFADISKDGVYNSGDEIIKTSYIRRGRIVDNICISLDSSCNITPSSLDITFKRPDPNAIIIGNINQNTKYAYAEITLKSSDGGLKKVTVRSTGQIDVTN